MDQETHAIAWRQRRDLDLVLIMRSVKVVPVTASVQEERAAYTADAVASGGDGWLTPERLASRAYAAARSPAEAQAMCQILRALDGAI